jgi:hypothetical protein
MIPSAQDSSRWESAAKKAVETYIECLNINPVDVNRLSKLMHSGLYSGLESEIIWKIRQDLPHFNIEFETEMNENELQVSLWFKYKKQEEEYSWIHMFRGKGQKQEAYTPPVMLFNVMPQYLMIYLILGRLKARGCQSNSRMSIFIFTNSLCRLVSTGRSIM